MTRLLFIYLVFLSSLSSAADLFDGFSYTQNPDNFFRNGIFIVPNEREFYRFDASVKGKEGVLLSVGTFRSLEAASRGEFSHLIMSDVDLGIVDFNQMQIEVLKKSPTTKDFVRNFLADTTKDFPPSDPLERANFFQITKQSLREQEKTVVEKQSRLRALLQKPPKLLSEFQEISSLYGAPEKAELFMKIRAENLSKKVPNIWAAFDEAFKKVPAFDAEFNKKMKKIEYIEAVLTFTKDENALDGGFLSSESRYSKLHEMAKKGNMHSVAIDLSGKEVSELGRRLKTEGLEISVIDASNAPDYFLRTAKNTEQFSMNLVSLPFASNAKFNFTTEFMQIPAENPLSKLRGWKYISMPINEFRSELSKMKQDGAFIEFLNSRALRHLQYEKSPGCDNGFAALSQSL